jgi:hypothetical protein
MKTLNIPPYREELIYNQRYPPITPSPDKTNKRYSGGQNHFFFVFLNFQTKVRKMKTVSDVEFVRVWAGVNFSKLKEN